MSWWKRLLGVGNRTPGSGATAPCSPDAVNASTEREAAVPRRREDTSSLHNAAETGSSAGVEDWLSKGSDLNSKDDNGNSPLILASCEGHTDIVRILLAHKASPNIRGVHETVPLHFAADRGHVEIAKLLINAGADRNPLTDDGRTPLHFAASNGHIEMVKFLLANGANAESNRYVPGRFMDWNVSGLTAQRLAERNGHAEVAKLIAEHKA